jgi:hypothetical protein
MRKLESYMKKYGRIEGKKMFTRLQREAALAIRSCSSQEVDRP